MADKKKQSKADQEAFGKWPGPDDGSMGLKHAARFWIKQKRKIQKKLNRPVDERPATGNRGGQKIYEDIE